MWRKWRVADEACGKGLDFKAHRVFFWFSGLVAVLSMVWVIILSLKLLQFSRTDPTLPLIM